MPPALQHNTRGWRCLCLALLMVVFGLCLKPTLRDLASMVSLAREGSGVQIDLHVYQTAAYLVHTGQGDHIYDGALDGTDPQSKIVPPGTVFARTGTLLGFDHLGMYVYPPLLIDLVAPMMSLSAPHAAALWDVLAVLCVLGSVLLLSRMEGIAFGSVAFPALLAGTCCLHTIYRAIWFGQATPLMLFCVVTGIACYRRKLLLLSALALSLAAAIKITPLLLFVPFVLWREWKWLRYAAVCLCGWLALMLAVNGPTVLHQFVAQVMPAMSGGFVSLGNLSLLSAVQVMYQLHRGGLQIVWVFLRGAPIPPMLITLTKLGIVLLVAVFLLIVFVRRRSIGMSSRAEVLAAAATLSVAASPVSWLHAYVLVLPLLMLLWIRCVRGNESLWLLLCTFFVTLQLTQLCLEGNLTRLHVHNSEFLLPWLTPLAAVLAAFASVASVRDTAPAGESPVAVP